MKVDDLVPAAPMANVGRLIDAARRASLGATNRAARRANVGAVDPTARRANLCERIDPSTSAHCERVSAPRRIDVGERIPASPGEDERG